MGNKESSVKSKPVPAPPADPPSPGPMPPDTRDRPDSPSPKPDPPKCKQDHPEASPAPKTEEANKETEEPKEDSSDKTIKSQEASENYSDTESELSEDETTEYAISTETPPVTFNLKLYCETDDTKTRSVKMVTPHTPETILDIKLCVEKEFSIPACCQEISFESQKLRECDSIEMLKIREGDTLTIKYQSEGTVEEVREIIDGMKDMKRFLRQSSIRRRLENGCVYDAEISSNLDTLQVDSLATMYFHPSADPRSKANRLFFVSNNGLQIMHQLHQELLRYPWGKCVLEMKYLEHSILRVLWNVSAAFSIRLLLLERSTLKCVIKSLVRVEIPANAFIQGPIGSTYEYKRVTSEMLYKAVGTIGK